MKRGYSHRALKLAYKRALESPWELLLFQGDYRPEEVKIRPILKCNKQHNEIMSVLGEHCHLLTEDKTIKCFVGPTTQVIFRRNRSTKDILTFSHFERTGGSDPCGTRPVGTYRCGQCGFCCYICVAKDPILVGSTTIRPKRFTNFQTRGIVYLLMGGRNAFFVGKMACCANVSKNMLRILGMKSPRVPLQDTLRTVGPAIWITWGSWLLIEYIKRVAL